MANGPLLWGLVFVQATLVVLDLVERRRGRTDKDGSRNVTRGTVGFLLAVTTVFAIIQSAGLLLIPSADETFALTRGCFAHLSDIHSDTNPLQGWPLVGVCVVAYYVGGFWDYVVHRFLSHSRWFWFTHEYHHLPRQVFAAIPGIFVRPFAAFPSLLTLTATSASLYFVFVIFGSPLWDLTPVVPVLAVIAMVLTASHSSFLRRWPAIHRVMKLLGLTTPQEHVLHHTWEMDGNFGNFTSVWDRLFGTYLDPACSEYNQRQTGLPYDQDFLGTLTFGRVKLSRSARERFQIARYCHVDSDDRPLPEVPLTE